LNKSNEIIRIASQKDYNFKEAGENINPKAQPLRGLTRKFNVGTELLVTWTKTAKDKFGETKVDKSLRHNIIPCNNAVKEVVRHKIDIFMNKEGHINKEKYLQKVR